MRDILAEVTQWLEQDERIALATVVETWGSAPRRVGARMAVSAVGKMSGSVSGGCVEAAVVEAGIESIKTGRPRLLHFGVADETAWDVGLACGGTIEVFVGPLHRPAFEALRSALQEPRPLVHAAVIRGGPDLLGREAIFSAQGKIFGDLNGALEREAEQAAAQALAGRGSRRYTSKSAPGGTEIFLDCILPPPMLVMVGGVHIARALTSLARPMGFQTVIVDPRRAFGSPERFAHADRLIQAWPDEAFAQFELTAESAVAVLSHDPKIDDPALQIALRGPAFYVGALGSRSTQAKRRLRLLGAGLSEAELSRLHAPIGLEIGAQTPEEIALAVMAEIVAARHAQPQTAER